LIACSSAAVKFINPTSLIVHAPTLDLVFRMEVQLRIEYTKNQILGVQVVSERRMGKLEWIQSLLIAGANDYDLYQAWNDCYHEDKVRPTKPRRYPKEFLAWKRQQGQLQLHATATTQGSSLPASIELRQSSRSESQEQAAEQATLPTLHEPQLRLPPLSNGAWPWSATPRTRQQFLRWLQG